MANGVSALENKPGTVIRKFRGVTYILKEVPIGKYDELQRLATKTIQDSEGNDLGESVDQQLLMRMLLNASLVEPKGVDVTTLGAPTVFGLNGAVNTLYQADEDEIEKEAKAKAAAKAKADKLAGKVAPVDDDADGEEKGKA